MFGEIQSLIDCNTHVLKKVQQLCRNLVLSCISFPSGLSDRLEWKWLSKPAAVREINAFKVAPFFLLFSTPLLLLLSFSMQEKEKGCNSPEMSNKKSFFLLSPYSLLFFIKALKEKDQIARVSSPRVTFTDWIVGEMKNVKATTFFCLSFF